MIKKDLYIKFRKFCNSCNKYNYPEAKFCNYCGKLITDNKIYFICWLSPVCDNEGDITRNGDRT